MGGERNAEGVGEGGAGGAGKGESAVPEIDRGPGSGLVGSRGVEEGGKRGVAVECEDDGKNTDGEGSLLGRH